MMERPLYVPIMLDALVYGDNSPKLADLAPDYGRLDVNPPFGLSAQSRPFTVMQEKSGVHLHWTLPDALLHGVENGEKTKLVFPRLPNRWLVHRIWQEEDRLNDKSWLVLSDSISYETPYTKNGMYKTTIPTFDYENGLWTGRGGQDYIYGFLGEAGEWPAGRGEGVEKLERLTATGPGDAAFASCYQNCKTVFGFYDNLKEAGTGAFTYLVTGYYEPEEQDPVRQAGDKAGDLLEAFHWTCRGGAERPDGLICHGAVKNVLWKGAEAVYPTGIPEEEVCAAVGNTSAEALSAFLQSRFPNNARLERLLNALQYHLIQELDNPSDSDALIELEEALHAGEFSAQEGEAVWKLRKKEDTAKDAELEGEAYGLLHKLNELQRDTDRRRQELESLTDEIYFSWWKFMKLQYEDEAKEGRRIRAEADDFLRLAKQLLDSADRQESVISVQEDQTAHLAGELNRLLEPKGMSAVKAGGGSYFMPNPPALLLAGEGLKRGFRQGFQMNEDGSLPCRGAAIDRLEVETERGTVTLRLQDMLRSSSCFPAAVESLLMEEMLLNTEFSESLAAAALEKAGLNPSRERKERIRGEIVRQQLGLKQSGDAPFSISDREWSQPWYPQFLHWSISIQAARTCVEEDDSFALFTLGDLDLSWKAEMALEREREYEGSAMLTPHAVTNLYHEIHRLIEDYGESGKYYEQLKAAAEALLRMDIMSQSLAGFQQALIMRDDKLFLPPYYPLDEDEDEIKAVLLRVTKRLEGYRISPREDFLAERFLPVRAGKIRLKRLWIVDAFGQIKDVPLQDRRVCISESIKQGGDILLPPRFLQPVTCRFRWLSFFNEDREAVDRQTTPVFGYLIPNFLDRSLQLFDAGGRLLGFVQITEAGAVWVKNPAAPLEPGEVEPCHLRLFVKRLLREESRAAEELLACLSRRLDSAAPLSPGTFKSLCFGSVIALARAAVDIRGKGFPPYVQQLNTRLETHGFDKETVPLALGDRRRQGNGLIGFFVGGAGEQTYETFHSCENVEPGEWLTAGAELSMSLTGAPRELTLLLNPEGCVMVRTGFLPAARYELPPAFFCQNMERMEVMFRLAPLLTDSGSIELPVPGGLKGEWAFLYRDGEKKQKETAQIEPPGDLLPARRKAAYEGFLKTRMKGGVSS